MNSKLYLLPYARLALKGAVRITDATDNELQQTLQRKHYETALPWVRVPHLASHLLGRITRRLAADWQVRYGHPVHLVETFVDSERFRGTCYRAANWACVGQTQGRSRQDRDHVLRVAVKDVYLYPLSHDCRSRLCHE